MVPQCSFLGRKCPLCGVDLERLEDEAKQAKRDATPKPRLTGGQWLVDRVLLVVAAILVICLIFLVCI